MIGRVHNWLPINYKESSEYSKKCIYTEDKSLFNISDVVLFHTFYLKDESQMPQFHPYYQKWIYFAWEAPIRHSFVPNPDIYKFNITWGISPKCDMYQPYGFCLARSNLDNRGMKIYLLNNIYTMNKLVRKYEWSTMKYPNNNAKARLMRGNKAKIAWFVSKCETLGKRELYVQEMRKYIEIDIFGKCGNLSCGIGPKANKPILQIAECEKMLEDNYFFYIAFENSICSNYVTEKVFDKINMDIIPIVYGGADYNKILPPKSFIDVKDFKSPKNLATFLKELLKNDELLSEFKAWRNRYQCWGELTPTLTDHVSVCQYLHRMRAVHQTVNIQDVWAPENCVPADIYYSNSMSFHDEQ